MKLKNSKKIQKNEKSLSNKESQKVVSEFYEKLNYNSENDDQTKTFSFKATRFELEQSLLNLWHVVDDLNLLYEYVLERDMTKDELANIILGMKLIYNMKHDKCMDIFEECVKNQQIS